MIEALFILLLGLTPPLLWLWLRHQADARAQARLRLALESVSTRGLTQLWLPPDQDYVEGVGYIIGDITCQYNARSSYLRCAVNPTGPCHNCRHYSAKPLASLDDPGIITPG